MFILIHLNELMVKVKSFNHKGTPDFFLNNWVNTLSIPFTLVLMNPSSKMQTVNLKLNKKHWTKSVNHDSFFWYSVISSKVIFICSISLTSRNNLGKTNKSSIYLGRKVETLKPRLLTSIKMKPKELGLAAE